MSTDERVRGVTLALALSVAAMGVMGAVWGSAYKAARVNTCTANYDQLLTEIETQIHTHTDPTPAQLTSRREWIERCRGEAHP